MSIGCWLRVSHTQKRPRLWWGGGKSKHTIMNQQAAFHMWYSYAFIMNTLPLIRSLAEAPCTEQPCSGEGGRWVSESRITKFPG